MTEKKKKHTLLKSAIIGGLGGALLLEQVKAMLFGRPPSKFRKAIFFTSVTSLLAYQCHHEKIDGFLNGTKEYVHQIVVDKKENSDLKDSIMYFQMRDALKKKELDSLVKENESIIMQNKNLELDYKKSVDGLNSGIGRVEQSIQKNNYLLTGIAQSTSFLEKNYEKNSIKNAFNEEYSSPVSERFFSSSTWYPVKRGETLSSISERFYGGKVSFREIAEFNGIENPELVDMGFPLKMPSDDFSYINGLRNDNFPENYLIVRRGQGINDVLAKRIGFSMSEVKQLESSIRDYNEQKGNTLVDTRYMRERQAIVYIPENLVR